MAVIWGVHSTNSIEPRSMSNMVTMALEASRREGFATTGEEIVVTAGVPFGTPGTTNALRVATIK
jgi:pyruvate kinase